MHNIPNKSILIEGIDGAGKSFFVKLFLQEAKQYYSQSNNKSISIFGEPDYTLENTNRLYKLIELGIGSGSVMQDALLLARNRQKQARILKCYSGLKICVRGMLTDRATLYARYGRYIPIYQHKKLDLLIIIKSNIFKALEIISRRKSKKQWRENYRILKEFDYIYSKRITFAKRVCVLHNTYNKKDMQKVVKKLLRNLHEKVY